VFEVALALLPHLSATPRARRNFFVENSYFGLRNVNLMASLCGACHVRVETSKRTPSRRANSRAAFRHTEHRAA